MNVAFAHSIGRSHTINELFEKLGGDLVIFFICNDILYIGYFQNLVESHDEPPFDLSLQEGFAQTGMGDNNEGTNCSMTLLIECTKVVGRVPASTHISRNDLWLLLLLPTWKVFCICNSACSLKWIDMPLERCEQQNSSYRQSQ